MGQLTSLGWNSPLSTLKAYCTKNWGPKGQSESFGFKERIQQSARQCVRRNRGTKRGGWFNCASNHVWSRSRAVIAQSSNLIVQFLLPGTGRSVLLLLRGFFVALQSLFLICIYSHHGSVCSLCNQGFCRRCFCLWKKYMMWPSAYSKKKKGLTFQKEHACLSLVLLLFCKYQTSRCKQKLTKGNRINKNYSFILLHYIAGIFFLHGNLAV